MGCDIHMYLEKRTDKGWVETGVNDNGDPPFSDRWYRVFGFLADVRNYSAVTPISKRRGIPDDVSESVKRIWDEEEGDGHSPSWLSVSELLNFKYDQEMEDRRYTRRTGHGGWDGGSTCEKGQGIKTTYREFLGERFFDDLKRLEQSDAERIVFWFDN